MKANHAHISFLLDRSGSMESIATDTIGGFNAFLASQKAAPGTATVSLAQFDSESHDVLYEMRPIGEAPNLSAVTFVPRGSTPLFDSMMKIINATGAAIEAMPEAERPSQVYVVILTDGLENASREFSRDQVFAKVKHQEDVYKWRFIYLGANQDAIKAGGAIGINMASSVSYQGTGKGVRTAYAVASAGIMRSRVSGQSVSFTDEERAQAIDPDA